MYPEDDFGFSKPLHERSRKAHGSCYPSHLIGKTLLEIPTEEQQLTLSGVKDLLRLATSRQQGVQDKYAETPSDVTLKLDDPTPAQGSQRGKKAPAKSEFNMRGAMDSEVDTLVFGIDFDKSGRSEEIELQEESYATRRMKRLVLGDDGRHLDAQRQSTGIERPRGLKTTNMVPEKQKHPAGGFKRQYAWIHKPTAWESLDTYEEPVQPGKRPTHPVCSAGPVSLERKRCYPEKATETGIPPPHMSKAPTGNTWGGWGRGGAPGRGIMRGPWQVEPKDRDLAPGEEAEFRVSDARVRMIPEMMHGDTKHLTTWHLELTDIDPPKINRQGTGCPVLSCSSTLDDGVYRRPAGKQSALFQRYFRAEAQTTPLTAR